MRSVFLLEHVAREGADDECVKTLGIYSSKDKATEAVEQYKLIAGFKDFPNGFYIDEYFLDEGQWEDGFFTEML